MDDQQTAKLDEMFSQAESLISLAADELDGAESSMRDANWKEATVAADKLAATARALAETLEQIDEFTADMGM